MSVKAFIASIVWHACIIMGIPYAVHFPLLATQSACTQATAFLYAARYTSQVLIQVLNDRGQSNTVAAVGDTVLVTQHNTMSWCQCTCTCVRLCNLLPSSTWRIDQPERAVKLCCQIIQLRRAGMMMNCPSSGRIYHQNPSSSCQIPRVQSWLP